MMCRVIVQTQKEVWQGEVDSWTSLVILAALSAEPESLDELAEAVRRYLPEHELFEEPQQTAAFDEAVVDGPWCLIDLAGRTVVAGGKFELPEPRGAYEADEDDHAEGFPILWLDTPEDWLFQPEGDWRAVVGARAVARISVVRRDTRAVLFGRPLLEHLAEGVRNTPRGSLDEKAQQERTRAIHAEWLMTARADLGERTPRGLLLAERNRLIRDLEHRSQQWSRQGHAVPALSEDALAYRFGGFATTEVVLYFDLVRALLAKAWELHEVEPGLTPTECVENLAAFRNRWLHEPQPGAIGSRMTPAELIESERRRMPIAGHGYMIDDDCPICQAEADGVFGLGFFWFDGHHLELENEFAFSLCQTREEWEKEQEEYRQFSEKMDRQGREREAAKADSTDSQSDSAWQTSLVNWDAMAEEEASPQLALFVLSFPLAELVSNLKDRPEGQAFVRPLNEAYRGIRAEQDSIVRDAAVQEFRDRLEEIARTFPDLTPKCADLQSRLDEVLRQLS
jgi:hypothetical protein